jgi:RNA polymerase sigma factor (sigma-70 family)
MNQDLPEGNKHKAAQHVDDTVPHGYAKHDLYGKVSAISSAFIEHSGLLKKFLTRFFYERQDIEDVVQEVYIRAYSAEKEIVIDQPKAFLFRVARNIALNELKKKARYIEDSIETSDPHGLQHTTPTLEEELQARQHLGLYCEAIAELPEQCRRVCLLRKVHGLKHQQIAERLSLTVSSVEKHLRKGALACQAYIVAREQGAAATTSTTEISGPHPISHAKGKRART